MVAFSRRRKGCRTWFCSLMLAKTCVGFVPRQEISPSFLWKGKSLATRPSRRRDFDRSSLLSVFPSKLSSSSLHIEEEESPRNFNWTKQNLSIALPALIGMLVDPMLSLMDTAYVGRVGSIELAALGACTSIFHLSFNAFRATTSATTALVASNLEKDPDSAKQVTSISLMFACGLGMAVAGLLLGCGQTGLKWMGVGKSSELYPAAADYLFTRAWAAPVVLMILVAEGAFRGYGNTVVPLMASLVAAMINLVLDPLLMFRPIHWGVRGAAAATALAQVGAGAVYGIKLWRQKMLPSTLGFAAASDSKPRRVIRTIVEANLAMIVKQGSLLLGWAYATARATRLGAAQVAAHQVAVSVWLIFALILDSTAVSSQVLMSRAYSAADKPAVKSLLRYMGIAAVVQGLILLLFVNGIGWLVPSLFTPDPMVQGHLHHIMKPLALTQLIVSLTLVAESLAIGANQFRTLAGGTTLATVLAVKMISMQKTVAGIWQNGIITLFVGRFATALLANVWGWVKLNKSNKQDDPI